MDSYSALHFVLRRSKITEGNVKMKKNRKMVVNSMHEMIQKEAKIPSCFSTLSGVINLARFPDFAAFASGGWGEEGAL